MTCGTVTKVLPWCLTDTILDGVGSDGNRDVDSIGVDCNVYGKFEAFLKHAHCTSYSRWKCIRRIQQINTYFMCFIIAFLFLLISILFNLTLGWAVKSDISMCLYAQLDICVGLCFSILLTSSYCRSRFHSFFVVSMDEWKLLDIWGSTLVALLYLVT